MPGGIAETGSLFGLYRRRIKRREAHLLTLVFDPKGGMARIRGLEAGGGSGVAPWIGQRRRIDEDRKGPFHCLRQSLTGWIGGGISGVGWPGGPRRPAGRGERAGGHRLEPDEGPVGTEVVIRGENFGPSIGAAQGTAA